MQACLCVCVRVSMFVCGCVCVLVRLDDMFSVGVGDSWGLVWASMLSTSNPHTLGITGIAAAVCVRPFKHTFLSLSVLNLPRITEACEASSVCVCVCVCVLSTVFTTDFKEC